MRASLVSLLALVAFVTLVAGVARANPHHAAALNATREPTDRDAIEHMRRGNRAIDVGAYDTAIHEYQLGAIADAVPLFWLDLGLAYRKAGRYTEAIDSYHQFLDRSAGDEDPDGFRVQVEYLLPQLQAARDAPPTHPAPNTGVDTPATTTSTATTTSSPTVTAPAAPSSAHAAYEMTTTSAQVSRWHDGPAWGLCGAGVVAGGVGVYLLANASSLDDQADHETDFSRRDLLRQTASSRRTIGEVTTAAGGVLLVAAVVRFALVGSPSTTSTSSLQLTPGPGDVGLGFALDF